MTKTQAALVLEEKSTDPMKYQAYIGTKHQTLDFIVMFCNFFFNKPSIFTFPISTVADLENKHK